ncbi:DUF7685 domain-containing protein [Sphingobium sp. TKS]
MPRISCDECHSGVPDFEITHFGSLEAGYRDLCSRCTRRSPAGTG